VVPATISPAAFSQLIAAGLANTDPAVTIIRSVYAPRAS